MSTWTNGHDSTRPFSPIGIVVDSDSDDENSAVSTPLQSTSPKFGFPVRRTLSSSALESSDRRISTDLLTPRPLEYNSPQFLSSRLQGGTDSEENWTNADANASNPVEIAFTLEPPPASPLETFISSTGSVELQHLPPIHPSTPDRSARGGNSPSEGGRLLNSLDRSARSGNSPSEGGRLLNSLWSLSPINKAFKESTPRTIRRQRKTQSESSDDDELSTRRSLVVASDSAPIEKQIRYEFETPRKGQLGLVIEASKEGPIVRAVKDYSPLFGLVKKGDNIVEVDGKRTLNSTLTEITRLLAVRPNRRSSHLRIAVTRSIQDHLETQSSASPRHSVGSSHGSTSDADAASDDLLRTTYYSDHSSGHGEV
jgi:hypothetical protein